MSDKSVLIGYIRKTKAGYALRMSIDAEAFAKATSYVSKDGRKFVPLIVNADKARQILDGEREVTSVSQMIDQPQPIEE